MTPLTYEQVNFAQSCVAKWMSICEEQQYAVNVPDASHSALLNRLLSGKKSLDKPPPLSFSYPNYWLAEGEEHWITEIRECDILGTTELIIDQCRDWEWCDKPNGILRHKLTGDLYKYWEAGRERLTFTAKGKQMETFNAHLLQRLEKYKERMSHVPDDILTEIKELFSSFGKVASIGLTQKEDGSLDEPNIIVYFEKKFKHTKTENIPVSYKGYSLGHSRIGKIRPC